MSARPAQFEEWLRAATKGLDKRVRERLELELSSHYQDAVQEQLALGMSASDAAAKAMEQLGEAQASRAAFAEEYAQETPWQREFLPNKLEGSPYGYVKGNELIGCTQAELIEACKCAGVNGREITLAWAPETERVAPVERIPFLLEAIKAKRVKGAQWQMVNGLLWGSLMIPALRAEDVNWRHLFVFLGLATGLPFYVGIQQWRAARALTAETLQNEATESERRFQLWCGAQKAPMTIGLMSLCALVFLMEITAMLFNGSAETAALVQTKVWEGEWWRLLTCVFVHAGMMHLLFNLTGLGVFGNLVEAIVGRFFLPVVFLATALSGVAFSLFLNPQPSVGASGGILGLAGFLFVMARRTKDFPDLPDVQHTVGSVALFAAVTGIIAFDLFDSSAHLGGLLGGLGLGWAVKSPRKTRNSPWLRGVGVAACTVLSLAALWAMALMTRPVPQKPPPAPPIVSSPPLPKTVSLPLTANLNRANFHRNLDIPLRAPETPASCIDLEKMHNFHFAKPWLDPEYSLTLQHLPRSLQTLNGVLFDARCGIQLAGTNSAGKWPLERSGITIGQNVGKVHFLHGGAGVAPEGTLVGRYVILLSSGKELEQPIIYGEHLREWHGKTDAWGDVTAATIGWSKHTCHETRVYHASWRNPDPTDAVASLSFFSEGTTCAPFLIAITIEPPDHEDTR